MWRSPRYTAGMKSERAARRYRQAVNIVGTKEAIEREGQALINALWAEGFRPTAERRDNLH